MKGWGAKKARYVQPNFLAGYPGIFAGYPRGARKVEKKEVFQGRILAVWILAPKLPNSDLKIAVDFFLVDFLLLFFPKEKQARKTPR